MRVNDLENNNNRRFCVADNQPSRLKEHEVEKPKATSREDRLGHTDIKKAGLLDGYVKLRIKRTVIRFFYCGTVDFGPG